MTPTEQWIFCLVLVYSVPSFMAGVGITLLVVHGRDVRRAAAMIAGFLDPRLTLEQRVVTAPETTPADEIPNRLTDRLGRR